MSKLFKITLLFASIVFSLSLQAQNEGRLGVGTENPTRTLHVQGDAQVKGLGGTANATGAHSEMLVADAQGNIEYANIWTVTPTRKRVWHLQYTTTGSTTLQRPITANVLEAGRFRFRFFNDTGNTTNNGSGRLQFCLGANPGQNVGIYLNQEQSWGDSGTNDGFEFHAWATPQIFTPANWNTYRDMPYGPGMGVGEMNEIYMSYPGENSFYRILVYRLNTTTSSSTWIITAEEYSN